MKSKKNINKYLLILPVLLTTISIISFIITNNYLLPKKAYADGTYANIGTPTATNAGSDALNWSSESPLMVDAYNNYISLTENNSGIYKWAISNNKGSIWNELDASGVGSIRSIANYDKYSDVIHILENTSTTVTYRRFKILRNQNYSISSIVPDPSFVSLRLDDANTCTGLSASAYPTMTIKDNGSKGILLATWNIEKDCSGTITNEIRASMRVLTNDDQDGIASNWSTIDGTISNTGVDAARVPYNSLYSYPNSTSKGTHSIFIRGGTGSKSEDLYFFNVDENKTSGFVRMPWNSSNGNWSGTKTTRATFGGVIDDSKGYNLKEELITKPFFNTNDNKVYIGISRWLNDTEGDTQSLYFVDSSDTVSLAGDVYSANGAAWFAPTMDIMFNDRDNKIYYFYETSSNDPLNPGTLNTALNGKTYYRTYDGTVFGTPQPFFTANGYSVDIPIVYQSVVDNKIISLFRVDGAEGSYTPPHNIYFGYISAGGLDINPSQSLISSPYLATTYTDFNNTCSTINSTSTINDIGGEVALKSDFRDDFENRITPYNQLFDDQWSTGVFSTGNFNPVLNDGNLHVNGSGGAYALSKNNINQKTVEFRTKFTSFNSQHAGFATDETFQDYMMFSTYSAGTTGHLYVRNKVDGDHDLGTGFLDAYHNYKIDWNSTDTKFYIDNNLVYTINSPVTTDYKFILSNNDPSIGSDLVTDWVKVDNYANTGTYTSCPIDSGINNADWGNITFNTTFNNGGANIQVRTSNDNITWSSYTTNLSNGFNIPINGRYLQYQITFSGGSTTTPTFNDLSIPYAAPVRGDFNNDGKVNAIDLSILLTKLGTTDPIEISKYDLNNSNSVNVIDLSIFLTLL